MSGRVQRAGSRDFVEWSPALIARLEALWRQADPVIPVSEIGRILRISKNAVVGKAHRLKLPGRPSPVRRDGTPAPPRPARTPKSAPLKAGALMQVPKAAEAEMPVLVTTAVSKPCMWPIGEPRHPDFHFCGLKGVPGRPYCAPHCAKAYVPVTLWRRHAA